MHPCHCMNKQKTYIRSLNNIAAVCIENFSKWLLAVLLRITTLIIVATMSHSLNNNITDKKTMHGYSLDKREPIATKSNTLFLIRLTT